MNKALVPILFLLFMQVGWGQSTDSFGDDFFNYKWLHKELPLDTLISYDNDTLLLKEQPKYYVLNFWFTSCSPCVAEIKWLNQLKADYQSETVDFLAVSFEQKADLEDFFKEHPFDWKQFYLERQVIGKKGLTKGYPTTLILDTTGNVVFQKSGGKTDEKGAKEIYGLVSMELEKLKIHKRIK